MIQRPQHGDSYFAATAQHGKILDFAANISPLGLPPAVQMAATAALAESHHYPDNACTALCAALGKHHGLPPKQIYCGGGAADIILRIPLALRPKKALLLAPSFSEYENALRLAGAEITYHYLHKADGFALTSAVLAALTPDIDIFFLCTPNNPTGCVPQPQLLAEIITHCAKQNIFLVLDECFIDFLNTPHLYTQLPALQNNKNLLILKAFTKLYAMAGLRLGYALCGCATVPAALAAAGAPWAVSTPAQAAGIAALDCTSYVQQVRSTVAAGRAQLTNGLTQLGLQIYGSKANFIFFQSKIHNLDAQLLQQQILIRSCANYHGLQEGFYRIAVRTEPQNAALLAALTNIIKGEIT